MCPVSPLTWPTVWPPASVSTISGLAAITEPSLSSPHWGIAVAMALADLGKLSPQLCQPTREGAGVGVRQILGVLGVQSYEFGGPRSGVLGVAPRLCMNFALLRSESHRSPSPTTPSLPRLALYNLVSLAWSQQPGLHSSVSKGSLNQILSTRTTLQEVRCPRRSLSKRFTLQDVRSLALHGVQLSTELSKRFVQHEVPLSKRLTLHKVPLSTRFACYKIYSPQGSTLHEALQEVRPTRIILREVRSLQGWT